MLVCVTSRLVNTLFSILFINVLALLYAPLPPSILLKNQNVSDGNGFQDFKKCANYVVKERKLENVILTNPIRNLKYKVSDHVSGKYRIYTYSISVIFLFQFCFGRRSKLIFIIIDACDGVIYVMRLRWARYQVTARWPAVLQKTRSRLNSVSIKGRMRTA